MPDPNDEALRPPARPHPALPPAPGDTSPPSSATPAQTGADDGEEIAQAVHPSDKPGVTPDSSFVTVPVESLTRKRTSRRKQLMIAATILVPLAAIGLGYKLFLQRGNPLANARALMAQSDLHGAEIELRRAVREMPDNAEAHYRLGLAQVTLGDPVAAEKELRTARNLGYPSNAVLPALARTYLAQRKFSDLLRDFNPADVPESDRAAILVTRALAQIGLRDLEGAEKSVTEAEALAPQNADAPLAGARIAAIRGDVIGALAQADKALTIDPKMVEAMLFKADVLRAAGRQKEALTVLDAALASAPTLVGVRLQHAATLLALNQNDAARTDVDALLAADPKNPVAIYFAAVLAVRAGEWQKANDLAGQIPLALPRMQRGDYFLALIKANVNQLEQADLAAKRYVAKNRSDPAGYKLLARIDQASGRPKDAIDVLKSGVDAGVGDAEMLDMLGSAYARSGDAMLGLQSLEKAAELAPDNPQLLARLGSTRLGAGDPEGAERDLGRAAQMAPERAEANEALVVAALAAGDIEHAIAALQQLRQNPKADQTMVGNLTGLVSMAQLDLNAARDAWRATVEAHPDSIPVRLNLARVLTIQGKPDEALAAIQPILDKEPANLGALTAAVNLLLAKGDLPSALALVSAARKQLPDNPTLLVQNANLLARSGDVAKALEQIAAAKPAVQQTPGVLEEKVNLLVQAQKPDDAIATLRQLVDVRSNDVDVRRQYIELLLKTGDKDGAVKAAQQAMDTIPGSLALMQLYVGAVYQARGLNAAYDAIDLLLRDPTNLPAARSLKGGLLAGLKRPEEALAAFQEQYRAAPSAALAIAVANGLSGMGRTDEAKAILTKENDRLPDPSLAEALAALQIIGHEYNAAEANLHAVLAARPADGMALNNLAWVYLLRNDPRARVAAQKAYTLGPSPQSADTLGWVLTKLGEPATGLMLLRQASQQLPSDPTVAFHIAYALNALNERAQAAQILRAVMATNIAFDERDEADKLLQSLADIPVAPPAPRK